MPELAERAVRAARACALPAALAGVSLVAVLAGSLFRDVYHGIPDSIAVAAITATCQPAGGRTSCDVAIVRLNPGRFYLSTRGPASSLSVAIDDQAAIARWHTLLVRPEGPGRLSLDLAPDAAAAERIRQDVLEPGERAIVDLPDGSPRSRRITFVAMSSEVPVVISELGFFADRHGLAPSDRLFGLVSAVSFYSTASALATLAVCVMIVALAWLTPGTLQRPLPWLLAALCVAVCVLDLGTMFSPHWSRDIRAMYGAEIIRSGNNGNLTGGLFEGSRLVQGLGETTAPDTVAWHRMPGYGLFCGLAALLGRTTDVVEIAMVVIVLQVLFYASAAGVFVAVARRAFGVPVACLLGVLIVLLPKQVNYTEVDSIIAPIALLVLSAIIVMLSATPAGEAPPVRAWLLVNAAFALWFLMRNDVLFGWIVVSAGLAGWHWRRLAVPLALMASIALPWALYKRQYSHEFNLMPTNAGEVLFLSLCEVPGAFPYECTDAGYFSWASGLAGGAPTSRRASSLAIAEVVRHWVTYPIHFGFMVLVKLRRCLVDQSWPGFRTRLSALYSGALRQGLFVVLLTLVGVAVAVDHQRRRSILLGWPLLLNMPIFLIVFDSSGRFYAAAAVSVLVTAVPLLFEHGFTVQLRRHAWRAAAVVACVALFMAGGPRVAGWVQANDTIHYWAPLLDPGRSTIPFVVAR
jgi:hypothetical protein